ncbi:hypothetical protein GSB46_005295 [Salmonella enterica]|nr:hypothetical protein [Salmonella enterica]
MSARTNQHEGSPASVQPWLWPLLLHWPGKAFTLAPAALPAVAFFFSS